MNFNNLRIKTKILGMGSIITVFMLVSVFVAVSSLSKIGKEIEKIANEDMPLIESLTSITNHQLEQAILFERLFRFGETKNHESFKNAEHEFENLATRVDKEIMEAEKIAEHAIGNSISAEARIEFQEVFDHIKIIGKEHHDFDEHVLEICELLKQEDLHGAEQLVHKVEQEEQELNQELEQLLVKLEKFTKESTLNAAEEEKAAVRIMLILAVICVLISAALTYFIAASIKKPLGAEPLELAAIAKGIANGDLKVKIQSSGNKLTGVLADMKIMVDKLSNIVAEVSSSANNVVGGSQQLSSTSQQMSQGATEQAASAEEASASMEQMSSNIQQNADSAQQTEKISVKAAQDANESGKSVSMAVSAMKEIAEKISIIEEIARQTNMLALNAAIEAARAGEHGKGFAVVAAEVRKLAERSQKAAGEISELSGSSVDVADKAGKMLQKLVPDIQKQQNWFKRLMPPALNKIRVHPKLTKLSNNWTLSFNKMLPPLRRWQPCLKN